MKSFREQQELQAQLAVKVMRGQLVVRALEVRWELLVVQALQANKVLLVLLELPVRWVIQEIWVSVSNNDSFSCFGQLGFYLFKMS